MAYGQPAGRDLLEGVRSSLSMAVVISSSFQGLGGLSTVLYFVSLDRIETATVTHHEDVFERMGTSTRPNPPLARSLGIVARLLLAARRSYRSCPALARHQSPPHAETHSLRNPRRPRWAAQQRFHKSNSPTTASSRPELATTGSTAASSCTAVMSCVPARYLLWPP